MALLVAPLVMARRQPPMRRRQMQKRQRVFRLQMPQPLQRRHRVRPPLFIFRHQSLRNAMQGHRQIGVARKASRLHHLAGFGRRLEKAAHQVAQKMADAQKLHFGAEQIALNVAHQLLRLARRPIDPLRQKPRLRPVIVNHQKQRQRHQQPENQKHPVEVVVHRGDFPLHPLHPPQRQQLLIVHVLLQPVKPPRQRRVLGAQRKRRGK